LATSLLDTFNFSTVAIKLGRESWIGGAAIALPGFRRRRMIGRLPSAPDVQTSRCSTKPDEIRPEPWDGELDRTRDEALFERVSSSRSRGPWIVALLFLAAAAVAAYIVFKVRSPQHPATAVAPSPAKAPESVPLGGEAAPIVLPPLDQSDAVVADLVRKLSSHPQVAAWLTTEGLIRNFAVVVLSIAEGKTPARSLRPLQPAGAFRVVQRDGAIYVDSRSYDRYRPLAAAVESIDANGSASLYATLKPRIEEAHRDLGQVDTSFDRTLERAIVSLLRTPIRNGPTRLQLHGIGYAFADQRDEELTAAQKQLLRMGPENARIVQAKLREIALALGIPSERLPR